MYDFLTGLRQLRQDLHQIPELKTDTPKTIQYIKKYACMDYKEYSTGLLFVHKGRIDDMIVFRCEMDGLDIEEATGLSFQSARYMHACGHDGHMAAMLIFMDMIQKQIFHHTIGFLFQNGEESGHGASILIEEGLFKDFNIKKMISFHIWPSLEENVIGCKEGILFACSSEFRITIQGKSAHVSQYDQGIDALRIIFELYQKIIALSSTLKEGVIHIGHMKAGRIMNQVADHAYMEGTIRCFDESELFMIRNAIAHICHHHEYRDRINLELSHIYPVLINDKEMVDLLRKISKDHYQDVNQSLASDDFASYNKVNLLYFLVGCKKDLDMQLHDSTFYYDEEVLLTALDTEMRLLRMLDMK